MSNYCAASSDFSLKTCTCFRIKQQHFFSNRFHSTLDRYGCSLSFGTNPATDNV
uniref:Uncharacterized protein n=1 Tax=Anguilla anguilla TaxID=7936 RepID=A0A0E9RYV8_ANGAN